MPRPNPGDPVPHLDNSLDRDLIVVKPGTEETTDAAARSSLVEADVCNVPDPDQTAVFVPCSSLHEGMDTTCVPTSGSEPYREAVRDSVLSDDLATLRELAE